ncbi:MAG: Rrf2 family transcriptional regulator [Elusimicrobia bacterium]|nr:Rrf2 family transcriptional regulator [Elusimicrobiota bacterium]
MKLTTRSEYALLALLHLARQEPARFLTVSSIASAKGIPGQFLEQLLLIMKRARYVQSRKGQGGGYRLAKPAEEIFLAEIIRLFDGALAPTVSVSKYFYQSTPIERERGLVRLFREIRDLVARRLERTSLADLR